MSFPVGSSQPTAATVALVTPRTLRKSRRLTPVFVVSWLMSVVAVGAVVAGVLPLGGGDGGHRRRRGARARTRRRGVARGFESFLRTVAVHVAADAPAHVEARELRDAIHLLDLAVTGLAGDAGVDVPRVREVDVLGQLVDADPRNGLGVRPHAGARRGDISKLV